MLEATNLIGFGAGSSPSQSFTFIGYCTGLTSLDFSSLSAGSIQAGDLAVYADVCSGSSVVAVTPSGFTNLINRADGTETIRGMLSVKKLTGSEGAITGMDDNDEGKVGLVFRPDIPFTTINSSTPTSQATTGNPSSQAISPSGESTAVIVLGMVGSYDDNAAFSTASPAFDAQIDNNDVIVGYKIYNVSPADHTIDANDLGTLTMLGGVYLTVS